MGVAMPDCLPPQDALAHPLLSMQQCGPAPFSTSLGPYLEPTRSLQTMVGLVPRTSAFKILHLILFLNGSHLSISSL